MVTKRRSVKRPLRGGITPAAIEAFRKLVEAEDRCTCPPIDWAGKYWERPPDCPACETWGAQNSILCDELRLQIWEVRAVEHPGARSPYPEGSYAHKRWRPNLGAQARYCALAEAAGIDPAYCDA
jgi:hypothetical protein